MVTDANARQLALELLDAIDAAEKVGDAAFEEHADIRRQLDVCWEKILARLRGQVSQP